jgi:hypothetical protein
VTRREAKIIEAIDHLADAVAALKHGWAASSVDKARASLDEARQKMAPGRPKKSVFNGPGPEYTRALEEIVSGSEAT